MEKKCENCGSTLKENDKFCGTCGSSISGQTTEKVEDVKQEENKTVNETPSSTPIDVNIKRREIITCILLSLLTCGIYSIYWFCCITNESNDLVDESNKTASGGLAILFTLLSCGIYGIYWSYKCGEKMKLAGNKYGINIEDRSVLYLILNLFGLGIVSYCLIQDDLNKFAK